jgi:hypothetical protein
VDKESFGKKILKSNNMKTLWPGVAVAIIVVLSFLLIRQCRSKPNPVDTTKVAMDALKSGYDSAKKQYLPQIAGLIKVKDSLTYQIDTLSASLALAHQDLQTRAGDIAQTLLSGGEARASHDTIRILQNCDSLRSQVIAGIPAVQSFEHISDSTIKIYASRSAIQDSIIGKLQKLNKLGDSTITAQQLQYEIIHKDDVSKTVQLRIYKPVAIGGVALVAAIIVLKFITK